LITLEENVGGCDAAANQNRNDSGGQFVDFTQSTRSPRMRRKMCKARSTP
jgi:hypothetical protein